MTTLKPGSFTLNSDGSITVIESSKVELVKTALIAAGSAIPRPIAAGAGMAASPVIIDAAINTAASLASGNYIGAVQSGVPLVIGLGTLALTLFTPSPKGLTDEQFKAFAASATHDKLIELLSDTSQTGVLQSAQAYVQQQSSSASN